MQNKTTLYQQQLFSDIYLYILSYNNNIASSLNKICERAVSKLRYVQDRGQSIHYIFYHITVSPSHAVHPVQSVHEMVLTVLVDYD